ncbi:NAD(P)/FAD-dependent oxidoreductase [Desulfonatronum sp. SC1]|uniref:protoporphyrinogen/coproporphyrinogen oxidase n=1 Tax=Desulfonatronum sp. SC1 TaxID=2109626 RepID=UPI000D324339|nr:FAD-dependent oxidoreductase [Desulfonatronum sp. SC1]PTN34163.1 amine oxidase [Desulfonatronum sp. SC1]
MPTHHVAHLIIGAGPTGLGAAQRLRELDVTDYLILEKNAHPGGLSASFRDDQGFTWDIGGHVVFSHYDYFDRLLEDLLGQDYLEHQRKAMIRIAETWVPYPFQNNIRHLPPDLQWQCIEGLLDLHEQKPNSGNPAHFRDWIHQVFGPGIADLFLFPYNFKVWAYPPETMAWNWIGERVSVVDLRRVLKNIVFQRDDVSWGPNNLFRFPLHGGTGEIFTRLARRHAEHLRLNAAVDRIDATARMVTFADGTTITYDALLNTAPLDWLILTALSTGSAPPEPIRAAARNLKHNGVHILGVGLEGTRADDTCWMYFPEFSNPFYRVTNFHNYSPNNTARPGEQRALMAEVSFSGHKPVDSAALLPDAVSGLKDVELMQADDARRIVSTWEHVADYGYPIPCLERDASLNVIQPWLESLGIFSRGRFGGWKYEVGNMDHSVMQGVEWAERMVLGHAETTYILPT